jgi:RNA polymerase sigma-70 factor (ECF subfamily)
VGRLVDSYLAARGNGDSREPAPLTAIDVLEQALSALHARGRDAHPALEVEDVGFAAHLGRCGAMVATGNATELHAEDLYLCCAGLLGSQAAARVLRINHRAVVVNYLRSIDGSTEFIEEVEQRLWQSALAGSPDAPPKLLSYSGRGPLASWTGVVAQRIALSILRHEDAEKRAHDGAATEARLAAAADPELDFVKASLRASFQRALTDALRTLDDRQRMVYRLHIVDGLTVEAIAEMYGVVRSTVTRWLAGARAAVIAETKRLLRDEMRVPPEEFDSLARLLTSQLDLNVSQILTSS